MRFNFFGGQPVEMVQFRITPDRTVHNKKVHDLFRSVSSFYVSPLERIRGKVAGAFWWDVMMGKDEINYYCTIPAEWKREIHMHIENTWPLCSIEELPFQTRIPNTSEVCEMKYRRSNMFALQTDRRLELEPMQSILSITHEMEEGDLARLSICAEPINRLDWQDWAERQHATFRKGTTPRRTRLSKRDLFVSLGEIITGLLQSVLDTVHTAISNEPAPKRGVDDTEKRLLTIDGGLSRGTINKMKSPTFNVHLRIAATSDDSQRKKIIVRAISNSFNDLDGDNELEREEIHHRLKPAIIRELNTYRISWPTRLDFDKNKMSNEELGRLIELPTAALQDAFRDQLETLNTRQIEVPAALTQGGIQLGKVSFKKESVPVFMPTHDWDQLCLPTVVIGGMGSGKTTFGCSRAVEYVRNGFSAIMVDPAKSQMWDHVMEILPASKRQRILLGDKPISLDFREVLHTPQARARLAHIMLSFFEDATDTAGAQTQRFLRAAVMGMQSGRLREIIDILTDAEYRGKIITVIPDGMHRQSLKEYHTYKPDRQRQILAPIMNRLDVILGDPYLEACMNTDRGIDMVELLSTREMCTVIDVPDRLNTRAAKDLLINLISFKIDAAMALRKDEFPLAMIYDEPHQYLRSVNVWENASVESRKYRISYHWLFHSWEQIPRQLAEIIKAAGPHYVIYSSSKATYRSLAEEIAPFTLEDGLNTKRYHAICAIKIGADRMTPLFVHMNPPI